MRSIVLPLCACAFVLPAPAADTSPKEGVAAAFVSTNQSFPRELLAFCAAKEKQARQLAADLDIRVAPEIWEYFNAAKTGEWLTVSNKFEALKLRSSQYSGSRDDRTVGTPVWQTMIEVQTAYDAFALGGAKYAFTFGQGILNSIPAGSIYFGGTDPGRGLVTALSTSHERAEPFFTLTQNALADQRYLDYLRRMYGNRIYIPSHEDSTEAFSSYVKDAQRRLEHDQEFLNEPRQIKAGESIEVTRDGRVQVSGQVAVMAINALLVKTIFDRNTGREFFVEESFPLDWMYPHLVPHELILKVNREELPALSSEVLDRDHAFWTRQFDSMIGNWLRPETSVREVCEFAEKIHLRKDLAGFSGDSGFATNSTACKAFSKLRSAVGGLYLWRFNAASDSSDKKRLRAEADFAFRQALALCPCSPETVFRYVNLLVADQRTEDALQVIDIALRLCEPSESAHLRDMRTQIQRSTGTSPGQR